MEPPQYICETLPEYTSSVYLKTAVKCKVETGIFNRRWCSVSAEVNNTMLVLRRKHGSTVLSMQNAKIGVAADYLKGKFPVRLKAGEHQILFDFDDAFAAVEWIEAVQKSINISLPLDLRRAPACSRQSVKTVGLWSYDQLLDEFYDEASLFDRAF